MRKYLQIVDTGAIALTTAPQTQPDAKPRVLGTITSFLIKIAASATGTLSTPQTSPNMISTMSFTDKNANVIATFAGTEIPYLAFLTSPRGTFSAGTANNNTTVTDQWEVGLPINANDQPLTISVSLAPYSSAATSGATGGTTEVILGAYYEDNPALAVVGTAGYLPTHYVKTFDIALNVGDNDYSNDLAQGINLIQLAFRITSASEDDFQDTTLRIGGQTTLEVMTVAALTARDAIAYVSGHQTAFFVLPHTPFKTDDATYFHATGVGDADTLRVYQIFA